MSQSPYLDPSTSAAREQVQMPGTLLVVFGGLGAALQLLSLLLNVLGVGLGAMGQSDAGGQFANLFSGAMGIVMGIFGLLVAGLWIVGGLKMKDLSSYGLAMAAAVTAVVPCFTTCCCLNIPVGIWALVVLMKPEVKAAFR